MDGDNIVKPVKQKAALVDKRNKYLNEWKSLFENIHSEIKVVLHFEQDFNKTLDGLLSDKDFQGFNKNAKIIITFPKDFELGYLIGLGYDRMYSEREVIQDHFIVTENDLDSYQPETNSWESFYDEVYEISKTVLSEIPKPLCNQKNLHE
jgi:hypothetical protein